jgi:hypothetical protein
MIKTVLRKLMTTNSFWNLTTAHSIPLSLSQELVQSTSRN